jgi:hypothetical protein
MKQIGAMGNLATSVPHLLQPRNDSSIRNGFQTYFDFFLLWHEIRLLYDQMGGSLHKIGISVALEDNDTMLLFFPRSR